jgi:hypothetical protein
MASMPPTDARLRPARQSWTNSSATPAVEGEEATGERRVQKDNPGDLRAKITCIY